MEASDIGYIFISFVIAALVAVYHYYTIVFKKKDKTLWIALILRFFAIFFLLILIFNPQYKKYNTIVQKPVLAVSFDNSASIGFLNLEEEVRKLRSEFQKSDRLKERFDISYFTFGNNVSNGSNLSFSEPQTRISDLFTSLNKLYGDKNLATVLISDGNQTFGRDYSFQPVKETNKVFPVLLGDTTDITDLEISRININKYAFTGNKFPVELFLNYQGEQPVETELIINSGAVTVFKEKLNFSTGQSSRIKNVMFQAEKPGVKVYKAQLKILEDELNKINNVKEFAIEIIDQKTEVLIVSDMLHPDLGAIKKSIESNDQRRVTFAKSNVSQEQLEKSQLVILYQPTSAFRNIFEKLKEQKRNYFIIGGKRTDWSFLNRIQDNFTKEWIRQTEEIQGDENNQYASFNLENIHFEEYPPLEGYLGDLVFSTPFEIVLFERIRNVKMESPLLVTYEKDGNRYGLLSAENIWKWRAHSYVKNDNFQDFDTFFGKLTFYLSSDKKRERLTIDYKPFYDGSNELKITASYFNKNYEFDKSATLILSLKSKLDTEARKIPLVLKGSYYEADISSVPAGSYNFEVSVEGENLAKPGEFRILDFDIEKQFLKADKDRMQRLAEASGGELIYDDQFKKLEDKLLEDNNYKPIRQSKAEIVSLIDFRYLLFLIISLLAAEWFIRKYKGYI